MPSGWSSLASPGFLMLGGCGVSEGLAKRISIELSIGHSAAGPGNGEIMGIRGRYGDCGDCGDCGGRVIGNW